MLDLSGENIDVATFFDLSNQWRRNESSFWGPAIKNIRI